jgi:hypothetical protein
MNELLASRYSEVIHRLAAGVEPIDAIRGARAGGAAQVRLEHPLGLPGARPVAHAGGRWSIRYVAGLPDHVDIRIDDPTRRLVPRRLRLPIVPEATVRAAEQAGGAVPAAARTWRPALFPAAAYPLASAATAIRGRALHAGAPARWVRVEATLRGATEVLWRAHGDDRGEFLLVVGPDPHAPAELPDAVEITLTVRAANPAPVPPAGGTDDPFWDLPRQSVAPPGPDDPVSIGAALPPDYAPGGFEATRDVDLAPGRIQADLPAFDLV